MTEHRGGRTPATRWRTLVAWMALGIVSAVLFGSTVHDELGDLGGDSALYVLLAESLATGQGYRDLVDPAQRTHTLAPPVFPMMLAPVAALWGVRAFRPMHWLVVGCAVVAVLLVVLLLHGGGEPVGTWLAGWMTAVHPLTVGALVCLWPEFPYLALSLSALHALHRYCATTSVNNRWLWLASFLTAAAVLTRTIGWALVAAGVCTLWPRRGRPGRVLLTWVALTLLPVVAWTLRTILVPHPPDAQYTYWHELWLTDPAQPALGMAGASVWWQRVTTGAVVYLEAIGQLLGGGVWSRPAGLLFAALAVCGWLVAWIRRRSVVEWYVAWYGFILVVFPWREERFLLPLLPLLWWYLWVGGRWLLERIRPRTLRVPAGALLGGGLALTLVGQGMATAQMVRLQHQDYRLSVPVTTEPSSEMLTVQWARMYGIEWLRHRPEVLAAMTDYLGLLEWMRRQPEAGGLVVGRRPRLIRLFAGRPALFYPFTTDPAAWRALATQPQPVLVVADAHTQDTQQYVWPMVQAHSDCFVPVRAVGRAALFRLRQNCGNAP